MIERKSLYWCTLGAATMAICCLAYAARVYAECPQEKPHIEACKLELASCAGSVVPASGCTSRTQEYSNNGPFGCEDNGENQTECLNGGANDYVECWFARNCYIDGQTCKAGNIIVSTHDKVIKKQDNCGGGEEE